MEHDEGYIRLNSPQPRIFVSEVVGYVRAEEARAFVDYGDAILNQHESLLGVHDWTAVMGYTNEARVIVTEWSVRKLRQLQEVHIALHAPMVRMAVAVANIPLKGRVTIHDSAESLQLTLRRLSSRPPPP
jgi:hypothetical protein